MGLDSSNSFAAFNAAVAYNSDDDEYLVVWAGDDDSGSLVDGEFEIFGQRFDADGNEIGSDFRISDMGPDGDTSYDAFVPDVAYNGDDDDYLVVWYGDNDTGSLVEGEYEIFGQLLEGRGAAKGSNFRISHAGPDGDTSYAAYDPAVAYNSDDEEYLVVWAGDDDSGSLADNEFEIFAQRVDNDGDETGGDFRVSDMGPDGNASYGAFFPDVAYNGDDDDYLVVWYGDNDTGSLVEGEYEIFGQLLEGRGAAKGSNFRISHAGPDGDTSYAAYDPAVAYNSDDEEYLVVWAGDDDSGSLADNEFEIFAQRVDNDGDETGGDFRVSDMGPDGDADYAAFDPAVAYNSHDNVYLVVWHGDDDTGLLADDEFEIFAQILEGSGGATGNNFRISDMGPDGNTGYDAISSAVAYDHEDDQYMTVWHGDDDTGSLVNGEFEIFGSILTINHFPNAVDDALSVDEDAAATDLDVVANDTDADGDTLTVTAVSAPTKGTAAVTSGSTTEVTYTPDADANGSDSFTYTVSDGNGGTAIGTVNVAIAAVNDAPVAVDDTLTVNMGAAATDVDVVANDTDADGDTLTVTAVGAPTKGTAAVTSGSTKVAYTPDADANGSDSFTYTVSDGNGGTATGTVNVTINIVPVAVDDALTVDEDAAATDLDVVANDTDADGDTLTVTAVGAPAKGTAAVTSGSTTEVTYTPDADANGSDSFTYTVSDGNGGTATGTVNVTITAVNDAPVAVDDTLTVDEDAAATDLDVVANDTDIDGDTLGLASVGISTKGTVAVTSGSTTDVTYTPDADANGSDSFTYTVSDGNGGTATGTVNVTITAVNDAPVAVDDALTVDEDAAATDLDVVANDTDADGDTLTVTAVGAPAKGTAAVTSGSTTEVTYTPDADANGSDSFTYTVSDGNDGTATGTVNVTITAVNDAPVAVDDTLTVDEDAAATDLDVVANDTDIDGDTLTVTAVGAPAKGTAAVTSGSTTEVTYTPDADANGTDSFTYTISDNNGGTATGTVNVTINDPPAAVGSISDRSMTTGLTDHEVVDDLTQYFTDVNAGDTLSYSVSVPADTIVVTDVSIDSDNDLNATSSEVIGATTVTVTATDMYNATDTQTFTLTVTPSGPGIRISDMGPDGNTNYDVGGPYIVYNSTTGEYLVVWYGDDDTGTLVDGENEVWGQLLDPDGTEVGTDFRISDMGPDGNSGYDAGQVTAVYNDTDNEYLVVWDGYDTNESTGQNAWDRYGPWEIWGQRLDADGNEIGTNDFRISDMGPDGNGYYDAWNIDVAYNSDDNEYLVVWQGDDNTGSLVNEEWEIYGQLLDADGDEIGTNDFRISDMGPDGNSSYDAKGPIVAYNSDDNEYLVVWYGDDNTGSLVDEEWEIFGQLLNADGNEIGTNDFRISDMGPDGNSSYDGYGPYAIYNSDDNEYLVVWYGDDNTGSLVDEERENFGQRLDADGNEIGTNDFRISDMGPDGNADYDAGGAVGIYNSTDGHYLLVWDGYDDTGSLASNEWEIFGQFMDADGNEIGTNDFRISDMGPDGDTDYGGWRPFVVYNSDDGEYFVVWYGDDDTGSLVNGELEVFGRRVQRGRE